MYNKIEINPDVLSPSNEIEYKDGILKVETNDTEVKLHLGWKPIRKIVDYYLKDVDQNEGTEIVLKLIKKLSDENQEKIFKELWDDPSYVELESENARLRNENEELSQSYQSCRENLLNLKYRRSY